MLARPSPVALTAAILGAIAAAPIVTILAAVFRWPDPAWQELAPLLVPRYALNTLLVLVGTVLIAFVLGVGTACFVTLSRFPGSRVLTWALLLPLAMPAYLMAYTYTTLLDFAGPVQTALRDVFGWGARSYWFPPIRSVGGAAAMLGLVLYPYVYLFTRAALLQQSGMALEAAKTLGVGPIRALVRVGLPLARPAIAAGLSLVAMETLADYGTVQYFAVETFSTGIFLSWNALASPAGATQLAAMLLSMVFLVLVAEVRLRGGRRFDQGARRTRPTSPTRLSGLPAAAALLICLSPIVLGFAVPVSVLAQSAIERGDPALRDQQMPRLSFDDDGPTISAPADSTGGPSYLVLVRNTLLLAGGGAAATMVAATLMTVVARQASGIARTVLRLAALGYAVPGAVIGLGVLTVLGAFDAAFDASVRATLGFGVGLVLSGSASALVYAYLVRFLAIGVGATQSGLASVSPNLEGAARCLGAGPMRILARIQVPLIRGSLLSGTLLVFVDAMKELPATLMIRPFNMDTLAIRVYQLASDELLGEASSAALTIVVVGLVPVLLLSRSIGHFRVGTSS